MIAKRLPDESNDSVNLIVSLLVRHPELSRVIIKPRSAALAFFFVVREWLPEDEAAKFRSTILEHVRAYHEIDRESGAKVAVRMRADEKLTFVEIERDARTLTQDEISMIVTLVAQTFGERLIVNPPADEASDDEFGMPEDAVGPALDAVRHGKQRKGLVGFREERRVLIYFGKT